MKPFDFLVLEKMLDAATVNDTATALGANRQQVMRWRARGLDDDEARDLAVRAGFEPAEVWPELKNGARPAALNPALERPPASLPKPAPAKDGDGEIVWCEPPRARYGEGSHVWVDRLAPLIERPGEWARVLTTRKPRAAHNAVTNLRAGRTHKPPGRWEFAARPLPDDPNRGGVWARYLGPDE